MKIETQDWIGEMLISLGVATQLVEPKPVPKPEPKPDSSVMPTIDVSDIDSPNYSERSASVDCIVIHNTDCNYDVAIETLCNPAEQVSAHLVIDRDGKTTCLVPFSKKAWHSQSYNSRSIGIECVAWKGAQGFTHEMEAKLVAWVKWMMKKYNIKIQDVIMHRQVCSTDCPSWLFTRDLDFANWKKEKLS